MNLNTEFGYLHDRADSLTGAIPLDAGSTATLLTELIQSSAKKILAFDLDSTLLNNRPRNAVIMREFGDDQKQPLLCTATAEHFQDWSARNAMAAIGLANRDIDRLVDTYRSFWLDRFFTSEYCQYDVCVPGAAEFVNDVYAGHGTVCYLTGRHEGMRNGTEDSLAKLGFPVPGADRVELLMKPHQDQSDDLFKVDTLQKLDTLGSVFAAFDNEPTHINSYRKAFPRAVCIHLLTDHSMRAVRLSDEIVSILDFVRFQ